MASISSDFTLSVDSAEVTRALDEYLDAPGEDVPDVVQLARRHRALPLWKDFMGCIALRPSGDLVFWSWDEPDKVERVGSAGEHDRRMVHAARAQGARRFAGIAGLAPARGHDARICSSCGGSGKIANVPENVVCECGGLGWVSW